MHHGSKLRQAKTNVSDSSWRVPYLHPPTKKVKKKKMKGENVFPFPSGRSRRTVDEPKFDVFLNPTKKAAQKKSIANLTDGFQKVGKWEFLTKMWAVSLHAHWCSFLMLMLKFNSQVFQGMDLTDSYASLFQVLFSDIFKFQKLILKVGHKLSICTICPKIPFTIYIYDVNIILLYKHLFKTKIKIYILDEKKCLFKLPQDIKFDKQVWRCKAGL